MFLVGLLYHEFKCLQKETTQFDTHKNKSFHRQFLTEFLFILNLLDQTFPLNFTVNGAFLFHFTRFSRIHISSVHIIPLIQHLLCLSYSMTSILCLFVIVRVEVYIV